MNKAIATLQDAICALNEAPKPLAEGFSEILVAISSELTASGQKEDAVSCYEAVLRSDGVQRTHGLAIWVLVEICRLQGLVEVCCADRTAGALDSEAAIETTLNKAILCFERVAEIMRNL